MSQQSCQLKLSSSNYMKYFDAHLLLIAQKPLNELDWDSMESIWKNVVNVSLVDVDHTLFEPLSPIRTNDQDTNNYIQKGIENKKNLPNVMKAQTHLPNIVGITNATKSHTMK